jgi:serine O-acetyltransferase
VIKSKSDLRYYLEADKIAMDVSGRRPHLIARYESDYIWRFERALRYTEYYHNCKSRGISCIVYKAWQYRLFRLQIKTGFGIPINVLAPDCRSVISAPSLSTALLRLAKTAGYTL